MEYIKKGYKEMKTYYETPDGTAFIDLESAKKYADFYGFDTIFEKGGDWNVYKSCYLCKEWKLSINFARTGFCDQCDH